MTIKKLAMAVMVTASVVLAGIQNENFRQLTYGDINVGTGENDGSQFWWPADGFSLKVPAYTQVWISNVINNWSFFNEWNQTPEPDLYGDIYQMTTDKFGYYTISYSEEDKQFHEEFHSGTTQTTTLTYTEPDGKNINKTTGYLLGKFDKDTEIFLAMTPVGSNELVDSYQYVRDPDKTPPIETTLQSRIWDQQDEAGNIRMNWGYYGITPSGSREFTIAYEELPHPTTGQPLPGVLFSGLLLMGTVGTASRLRRRKGNSKN